MHPLRRRVDEEDLTPQSALTVVSARVSADTVSLTSPAAYCSCPHCLRAPETVRIPLLPWDHLWG